MQKTFLTILAAVSLAGCSSGSSVNGIAPAGSQNVALPDEFAITDNGNGTFTIFDGTSNIVVSPVRDAVNGGSTWYGVDTTNVFVMETPSGAGEAYAFLINTTTVFGEVEGAILVRNSETVLPDSGSATFNGYTATWRFGSGASLSEGEIELRASFDTGAIEGEITNRWSYGTGPDDELGSSFPDILLNPGTISNGGFSGTTTGGYFGGTAPGTYSGLFVGPSAEELVGQWQLDDPDNAIRGAFWAAQ